MPTGFLRGLWDFAGGVGQADDIGDHERHYSEMARAAQQSREPVRPTLRELEPARVDKEVG